MGGSPHLSCKYDQITMREYMNSRVTPPKRITSPTWGPPPLCKQALKELVERICLKVKAFPSRDNLINSHTV